MRSQFGMGTAAFIGMGSNLGDRKAHLDAAVAALRATPGVAVSAVSSYHETPPVGGPAGQGGYLNAAAALDTSLSPAELLAALQAIEAAEGRVRSARWGERTLDLDLLLFGDHSLRAVEPRRANGPYLEVPHPWFRLRRFVLIPLAEIAPAVMDPVTGQTVIALLANLDRRPSYVAVCDPWDHYGPTVAKALARALDGAYLEGPRSSGVDGAAERFQAALDAIAAELDGSRWSAGAAADRWLVTPYWFDAFVHHSTADLRGPERDAAQRTADAVRASILRPTFVVAERSAVAFYRGETPVLIAEPTRSDAIVAKALDSCGATRAGRPRPDWPLSGPGL